MKRFRNSNGQLTESIKSVKEKTLSEAMDYYRSGHIYLYKEDNREYVYCVPESGDGELAHFMSFDGYNLFVPVESLGTFLPDVADEGRELIFVE